MNGFTSDALCGVSMAEQRIKGTLTGVLLGVALSGALAYMFAPQVTAILGARKR